MNIFSKLVAAVTKPPEVPQFNIYHRVLVVLLLAIVMPAFFRMNAPSAGLVGFWLFDNSGSSFVPDVSGNGNKLTLTGTARVAPGGRFAKALWLANDSNVNNNAAVDMANHIQLNFATGDFSIQAWVNFRDFTRSQTIIEKFTGAAGPGWTLTAISSHDLQFYGGGTALDVDANLATGTWNQIVVTRSGGIVSIYVNAALVGSAHIGAITDSPYPLLIGTRNIGDVRRLGVAGLIDEVGLWSRALSSREVSRLNGGFESTDLGTTSLLMVVGIAFLYWWTPFWSRSGSGVR